MSEDDKQHNIVGDDGAGRQKSLPVNLPSNSNKSKRVTVTDLKSAKNAKHEKRKQEALELINDRPKLDKVISGKAVEKKKWWVTRVTAKFAGDDARSVGSYLLYDVFIPAFKDMLADAAAQGTQRLLFGDSGTSYRSRSRDRGEPYRTPYGRMSTGHSEPERHRRELSHRDRAAHDFRDIVVETRRDAEDILDALYRRIDDYGSATVADLYDLADISGSFTDDKWGWFDLRNSGVKRVRDGFCLVLPRPEVIE